MSKLVYGVDFGTTNTVVALSRNGVVSVLPIGFQGKKSVPSILFFPLDHGGYWIGDEAIQMYVSSGMRGRLMQSIKMLLPDLSFEGTEVSGFGYCSLENLISLILQEIKSRCDLLVGENVTSVVLGRPGRFSDNDEEDKSAEERLRMAAKMAGFEEIHFQREPVAAAFHYETSLEKDELALIADLGGGTSDFTLAHLSPDKRSERNRSDAIVGTNSVSFAGDEFDSAIMWHKITPYLGADSKVQVSPGKWLDIPAHYLRLY